MKPKRKKQFQYKMETVDMLFDIIRLKNLVIREMNKEIDNLRNLLTRRKCEKKQS